MGEGQGSQEIEGAAEYRVGHGIVRTARSADIRFRRTKRSGSFTDAPPEVQSRVCIRSEELSPSSMERVKISAFSPRPIFAKSRKNGTATLTSARIAMNTPTGGYHAHTSFRMEIVRFIFFAGNP